MSAIMFPATRIFLFLSVPLNEDMLSNRSVTCGDNEVLSLGLQLNILRYFVKRQKCGLKA